MIGRAKLDGSGADNFFITGASVPCGVAVDGAHIYWANEGYFGSGTTIGRANLDGTDVDQEFISGVSEWAVRAPRDCRRGETAGAREVARSATCEATNLPPPSSREIRRLPRR